MLNRGRQLLDEADRIGYAVLHHHYEVFVGFDLWLHHLNLLATGEIPPPAGDVLAGVWTYSDISWRGHGDACTCSFLPFPHRHSGGLSEAT